MRTTSPLKRAARSPLGALLAVLMVACPDARDPARPGADVTAADVTDVVIVPNGQHNGATSRDTQPDDLSIVSPSPDGPIVPTCCGRYVCLRLWYGGVKRLAPGAFGCEAGACRPCSPRCEGRDCGPDGCGGTCAACDEGETCVSGTCACVPQYHSDCCPAEDGVAGGVRTLCRYDACGGAPVPIAQCPGGCSLGDCRECVADCLNRECGVNGCGASCGATGGCADGAVCAEGRCVCGPGTLQFCCGDAPCAVDACGAVGPPGASCPLGCLAGVCLGCVPDCLGRACGLDGCGGSCGACAIEGQACGPDGQCACEAAVGVACCTAGGGVCSVDACGGLGTQVASCPHGCVAGACQACQSACAGKACGPNGCGGSCGTCPTGSACTAAGLCAATATATLTGRFLRERRVPNAARTGLAVEDIAPAARVPVLVTEGGVLRASVETDEQGRVSVPLTPSPAGVVTATLITNRVGATGQPLFSVIDSAGVSYPATSGVYIPVSRVWAWAVTAPANLAFGDVTITAAQGSGALQLYGWIRDLHASTSSAFADAESVMPSLAVLWSPDLAPPCGACYLPSGYSGGRPD